MLQTDTNTDTNTNTAPTKPIKLPFKFFTIVKEQHKLPCSCSYCYGKYKLHYGLNIPKQWRAFNAWYVLKYGKNKYFRWTNTWLRAFKKY